MDLIYNKNPVVFNKPEIIKVGNCNYRKFHEDKSLREENLSRLAPYTDNDDDFINCAEIEDDIDIKVTKSGKYMTTMHVAPAYFAAIIGMKGTKKREIEMDTGAYLKIPKQGESGDIIITGISERDVTSARNRVNMIVLQMRDRHQMTHFVSIPVISDQIKFNFEKFKTSILNGPPLRGVDETIFQKPDKFHLTIAPMVLLDEIEKDTAIQAFIECRDEIINPLFRNAPHLKIRLEGLEIMNDDPTEVDVLYAKVKMDIHKYNSSFQKLADQIVDHFSKKGLIRKQYENVKLHVTLMNSLFRRKVTEETPVEFSNKRETFDSSYILEKHRNYFFGEAVFRDINISIRFSSSDNGYYESLFKVTL